MTFRVTLGIDPGQTGALAIVADGRCEGFIDMPVMDRKAGGHEVNTADLAARLRGVLQNYRGAYVIAILEQVNAMPSFGGKGEERRQMGSSSAFRFGESFGALKGVLGALSIPYVLVHPATWKRQQGLQGTEKDYARTVAIQRFPEVADQLTRKKDIGRADSLLLARWGEETEQVPRAA